MVGWRNDLASENTRTILSLTEPSFRATFQNTLSGARGKGRSDKVILRVVLLIFCFLGDDLSPTIDALTVDFYKTKNKDSNYVDI